MKLLRLVLVAVGFAIALTLSFLVSSLQAQDDSLPTYGLHVNASEATPEEVQIYAAEIARRAKNIISGATLLYRLHTSESDRLEEWQSEFDQNMQELLALESPRDPDAFAVALTLYIGRGACLSLTGIVFETIASDPGGAEMQVANCIGLMQIVMGEASGIVARTAGILGNYEVVQALVDEDNSPEARREVFDDFFGEGIWQYLPEEMDADVMVSLSALQTAIEDAEGEPDYVGTLTWQIFWAMGWHGIAEIASGDLLSLATECGEVARKFSQAAYENCLSDFEALQQ